MLEFYQLLLLAQNELVVEDVVPLEGIFQNFLLLAGDYLRAEKLENGPLLGGLWLPLGTLASGVVPLHFFLEALIVFIEK